MDFTIADFVADLRAPTPSAAAEMVSGAREDLRATVTSLQGRLSQAMMLGFERRRSALDRLSRNRAFITAPNRVKELQQRFDEAALRMNQAMERYLTRLGRRREIAQTRLVRLDLRKAIAHRREVLARNHQGLTACMRARLRQERARLALAAGRLDALSPLAILQRGYAICRDENGAILRDAAATQPGRQVGINLARGSTPLPGRRCGRVPLILFGSPAPSR